MGSCRHMADLAKVIHKICGRARYLLSLWLKFSEHWAVLSPCHPSFPESKRDHFRSDLSEIYGFPQPKSYREAVRFSKSSFFFFLHIWSNQAIKWTVETTVSEIHEITITSKIWLLSQKNNTVMIKTKQNKQHIRKLYFAIFLLD